MAINAKTGGKAAKAAGMGLKSPSVKGNAPGGVKKRAKVPARQKGTKVKTGTGGNVTVKASGKSQKTTIGNNRAGYAKTGIQRQFLG